VIVIGTTPGREHWLKDCLASIQKEVLILSDCTYEIGKIKWCAQHLKERFLFLQDSIICKKIEWIEEIFNKQKSVALFNDPCIYGTYMGIYDPVILNEIEIPTATNKAEAVHFEIAWTTKYVQAAKDVEIAFPEISDSAAKNKEMRYGRLNLILENEHLIKYKGNWGQKPLLD